MNQLYRLITEEEHLLIIFTILSGILFLIMLLLFIMERKEQLNLQEQIKELKCEDSNLKLHSQTGLIDGRLINEINTLFDELQKNRIHYMRKNHEIELMMANISHDLRTPLTSALGYIDIIQNSDMSENEKKQTLEIVEKRLIRLKELIDAFFDFSMSITGETRPEMSQVNLISVLEESISHYYDDYVAVNRKIDFVCESRRINICSNKNMMMRIFDNLIINALRHGAGDLLIKVHCDEKIIICFDNKTYDSELDTSHIFDEFYTTDISRTKGNTGLGLAIVRQFVEILNWSVSAKKQEDILSIKLDCRNGG